MGALKIAFVGCAHMHANGYAAELLALPEGSVQIAGVWDRNQARAKKLAASLGAPHFPSIDKLFRTKPHGAVVCSENVHHMADTIACANAGVAVMCEKPLAPSVADAKEMLAACRKAGVPLMTAFPCRFRGALVRLRDLISAGEAGEVLAAVTTNHGRQPGGWFADPALSGGGAVMDHTVHVADLLRWILGREFTHVYAAVGYNRFALTRKAVGDRRLDDAGLLSLEMEGGTVATLDCSWSRPAAYPIWGDVSVEIVGSRAVITADAFRQRLMLTTAGTRRQVYIPWGDEAEGGLGGAFVNMLREGRTPPVTGEDGLRATEVVEAAYRSAETGKPVKLQHARV